MLTTLAALPFVLSISLNPIPDLIACMVIAVLFLCYKNRIIQRLMRHS